MIPHSNPAFCCLFTETCLSLSHLLLCCFYRQCVFSQDITRPFILRPPQVACIVGHATGFAVGLSGPSNSGPSADVADRRRLAPPGRPLPLLDRDLDLDLECVLPLRLEVLCLDLLSSRRSKALCKRWAPAAATFSWPRLQRRLQQSKLSEKRQPGFRWGKGY
jgi:hypothetical protein